MTEPQAGVTRRRLLATGGAMVGSLPFAGRALGQDTLAGTQTWPGQSFGAGLLNAKVAVITGAARGIGRAIAVDMAANGADVVGIDICAKITPVQTYAVSTREDLEQTGKLVQQHGRKFMPVVGDIRDISFLRSTANSVEERFGHIDIVVANAATQFFQTLAGDGGLALERHH